MPHSLLRLCALLIFSAFLFTACSSDDESSEQADSEDSGTVVATINDSKITGTEFADYKERKLQAAPENSITDADILDEMITIELVKQQAISAGIDQRDDFKATLDNARDNLLVSTFMKEKFGDIEFTDEELQEEYDAQTGSSNTSEYKARHILLETEEDANTVIKELDDGADFTDLAREKSTGPSGPNGGDLGWFQSSTMVKPFAEAVEVMEKGEYSKKPVNTQFGWHVILLEDSRTIEPPSLDEMKNQLIPAITKKKLQSYLQELKETAKIDITQ